MQLKICDVSPCRIREIVRKIAPDVRKVRYLSHRFALPVWPPRRRPSRLPQLRLPENPVDRVSHHPRVEMPVSLPLLFRLVPDDLVDHPLVDAFARQGRDERVPEHVIAAE